MRMRGAQALVRSVPLVPGVLGGRGLGLAPAAPLLHPGYTFSYRRAAILSGGNRREKEVCDESLGR